MGPLGSGSCREETEERRQALKLLAEGRGPPPGGAWSVGWLCSPALVTLPLPPTQVILSGLHGPSRTRDRPGRLRGKWAGQRGDQSHCRDARSESGGGGGPSHQDDSRGRQREMDSRYRISAHCPSPAFALGRGRHAADLMRPCVCFHKPSLNIRRVQGCCARSEWGTGPPCQQGRVAGPTQISVSASAQTLTTATSVRPSVFI